MFNLAMLAHQGWRLIQNLDSLCAQILLAKYGVNGSLLEAKEGPGISYSWHSIIRGVVALQKGLIWHVGDGTNIRHGFHMGSLEGQSLQGEMSC